MKAILKLVLAAVALSSAAAQASVEVTGFEIVEADGTPMATITATFPVTRKEVEYSINIHYMTRDGDGVNYPAAKDENTVDATGNDYLSHHGKCGHPDRIRTLGHGAHHHRRR